MILLLSFSVYAIGQVMVIEFPSSLQQQRIAVGVKDRIDFYMLDGNHTIIIDKIILRTNTTTNITSGHVELDIHPYINRIAQDREVVYINIDKTRFATIDLNKDLISDLEIRMLLMSNNATILQFDRVNKSALSEKPKPIINPIKDTETKKETNIIIPIAITILVFAIMFIIYLLIFRKSKV